MRGSMHHPRPRLAALLLAVALAAFVPLQAVSAHAHLVRSDPAPGSVLDHSPAAVTATFGEEIEPSFSSMTVVDAGGHPVTSGPSHVLAGNRSMQVPLKPDLPPGVYTVDWQNLSSDGHKLSGSFTFRVASSSASGSGSASAGSTPPTGAAPASAGGAGASGAGAQPAREAAATRPAGSPVLWAAVGFVAGGVAVFLVDRWLRR
ncbi:MAG: copper resistance protein CopC [Bacillota bacterium]|nr:copper resistance protein CopC [Bacillota bacterium]